MGPKTGVFSAVAVVAAVLLLDGAAGIGSSPAWTYIRGSSLGPSQWGTLFPTCAGSKNSPIDIDTSRVVKKPIRRWNLDGYNDKRVLWKVKDKEDTVEFELEKGDISISGGYLNGVYNLAQFHFHWGSQSSVGAEHLINGKSAPLEVHFVHYRSDFASIGDAAASGDSDALAVLGFLFKIQRRDNRRLNPLLWGIRKTLSDPDKTVEDVKIGRLTSFLRRAISGAYYRYEGGLTTPTCNEVVAWTVFQSTIRISERQMNVFRMLPSPVGTERYRPVQPIGSRKVTLYTRNFNRKKFGRHH